MSLKMLKTERLPKTSLDMEADPGELAVKILTSIPTLLNRSSFKPAIVFLTTGLWDLICSTRVSYSLHYVSIALQS